MPDPDPGPDRGVTADAAAYVAALRDLHTTRAAAVTHGDSRSLLDHEAAVAALDDLRRDLPPARTVLEGHRPAAGAGR
jgi:hypothetical protein